MSDEWKNIGPKSIIKLDRVTLWPNGQRPNGINDGCREPEFTGGNVNYYVVPVPDPKRLDAYTAECEDIIQALGMTFAEGCAFKAIWRSAAARTLGLKKTGQDAHGVYDAEKVIYYGNEMLRERKRAQAKSNKGE